MSLYDLRFTPTYIKSHADESFSERQTRRGTYKRTNDPKSKYSHSFTKPYLIFPEYYSGDETGRPCNIDLSTELGLLAACMLAIRIPNT